MTTTMAGDKICQQWLVDYILHKAFQEYKDAKSLPSRTVDLISGVLPENFEGLDVETQMSKIYFLVVLCRMSDGEKVFIEYMEGQDNTVLEDMLPVFEKLVKCQRGKLVDEGLSMIDVIKIEAVIVCCRKKDYERANQVFKRHWSEVNCKGKKKMKTKSLLKDLINPKTDMNEELKTFAYSDFQTFMIKYLEKVQRRFNKPLLLQAAEVYLKNKTTYDKELMTRSYANKKLKKDDLTTAIVPADANNNCEEQKNSSKRKVRTLWDNQIKELFGSPSPEKQDKSQQSSNHKSSKRTLEDDNDSLELSRKSSRLSAKSTQTPEKKDTSQLSAKSTQTPEKQNTIATVEKENQVGATSLKSPQSVGTSLKSPQSVGTSLKSPQSVGTSLKSPLSAGTSLKSPKPGNSGINGRASEADTQKKQTDATFKSPSITSPNALFKYRKNQGRQDRHEPSKEVGRDDDSSSSASSFDNQSLISVSSRRKKWTSEEVEDFFDAVISCGVGRWAAVRDFLGTTRTNVMLKDKWRTMIRTGEVEKLKAKRGKKKR